MTIALWLVLGVLAGGAAIWAFNRFASPMTLSPGATRFALENRAPFTKLTESFRVDL